jgi:hypothetical protein
VAESTRWRCEGDAGVKEIAQTRAKLDELLGNLLESDEDRCISDLTIFYDFLVTDPFTAPIVEELGDYEFNFEEWTGQAMGRRGYRFPPTERDRAAMCLAILNPANYSDDPRSVWGLSSYLHLNRTGINKIFLDVQAFFETFAKPLFQYVDHRLRERESMVTPSDIMLEVTQVVGESTIKAFPKTVEALQTAYRDLYSASGKVIWRNVGNACRAALIAFADEIYDPSMAPADVPQPKGDDAKQRIVLALRHYWARKSKRGHYLDALEALIKATWDMAVALVHRKDASANEAKACVMYTYLAVWTATAVISE